VRRPCRDLGPVSWPLTIARRTWILGCAASRSASMTRRASASAIRRPVAASSSKSGCHSSGISASGRASCWRVRKRRSSNRVRAYASAARSPAPRHRGAGRPGRRGAGRTAEATRRCAPSGQWVGDRPRRSGGIASRRTHAHGARRCRAVARRERKVVRHGYRSPPHELPARRAAGHTHHVARRVARELRRPAISPQDACPAVMRVR